MVSTNPFMIIDSDQTPDRVGGGLPGTGTGSSVIGFADPAALGADTGAQRATSPRYRYEGPLGPVLLTHVDAPARTLLSGPSVPDASFDVGAPEHTDAVLLKRRLQAGIGGRVGELDVHLVRDAATGAVHLDVADGRYELTRTGWFPRALLSRPDLSILASYQVVGRSRHRLIADAAPHEVVLAAFMARFAPLVAYRD
jgi:hypothetical protein